MLRATRISKSYGQRKVLHEIDLDVHPGAIVALLGANGCGKSTLLRALALLDPADQGSVEVDGVRYGDSTDGLASPWPLVTMVFQRLFLWPHLTVRQNIALPLASLASGEASARLAQCVDMFRLGEFLSRYPNEISIGQQQRVALARALAVRPRYLLLDEVTSALDVEQTMTLLDYLRHLRDNGLGIVLVTHLIGFAREAADRVLFLSDGHVIEDGDASILRAPRSPELRRFLSLVEPADLGTHEVREAR